MWPNIYSATGYILPVKSRLIGNLFLKGDWFGGDRRDTGKKINLCSVIV